MSRRTRTSSSSTNSRSRSRSRGSRRTRTSYSSRSRSRSSSPRDRDYREQPKNRTRNRSRSRSRDRHYSSRGSPSRKRERSRSPQYSRRRSPVETKPSHKVILTSLPNYADKDVLNILLARQAFHPVDIRVIRRNTDSGTMRVFGFVEFSDVATAEAWINFNQGYLKMDDGFQAKLEYSREEATRERQPYNPSTSDWTCSKCTINNFNRRINCFKCGTSRHDSDAMEAKGYAMVGVTPSDTLLIRELPSTVSEESIRHSMAKYTKMTIQRIQLAASKLYAFVQMKSAEEAGYVLQTFNKQIPYIDNCAVIITYSRQSLNQILIMENVQLLKSQSGISSSNIHDDPTNSAAQLAHNAIRIVQMGRAVPGGLPPPGMHPEGPARQSVSTPFGYLPTYETPNQNALQFEPSSGYYYDASTGFYFDAKTRYYYNSGSNNWMFWSTTYNTYIDCEGGDLAVKKRLQEEEREAQRLSQSAVISAPPSTSSAQAMDAEKEKQLKLDAQALSSGAAAAMTAGDEPGDPAAAVAAAADSERRKKKRRAEEEELDKPKTPQEIQKEMQKWARRQEKIKMSFIKQPGQSSSSTLPGTTTTAAADGKASQPTKDGSSSSGRRQSVTGAAIGAGKETKKTPVEAIKKPWVDDDDEEEEAEGAEPPADAILPAGRMRGLLTNRQARVRMARAELLSSSSSEGLAAAADPMMQTTPKQPLHDRQQMPPPPPHHVHVHVVGAAAAAAAVDEPAAEQQQQQLKAAMPPTFDEQKYICRQKNACLICRRQFPNAETLDKHVLLSALHKTNVAEKIQQIQKQQQQNTAESGDNGGGGEGQSGQSQQQQHQFYRDRARERREHFGYDPDLAAKKEATNEEVTKAAAAYKASTPLDASNVGNRMLKSMGWSEGRGLGRNLQGIVNPIQAEQHVQGVGLGSSGSKIDANASWKDRNRAAAIERFRNIRE